MYSDLCEELESTDPKMRVIIGALKGLNYSMNLDCTLNEDEVDGLFIRVKTAMQQLEDVRNKGVQKESMKLFTNHTYLFKRILPQHAEAMVRLNLMYCVDSDIKIRDLAIDMLGA